LLNKPTIKPFIEIHKAFALTACAEAWTAEHEGSISNAIVDSFHPCTVQNSGNHLEMHTGSYANIFGLRLFVYEAHVMLNIILHVLPIDV